MYSVGTRGRREGDKQGERNKKLKREKKLGGCGMFAHPPRLQEQRKNSNGLSWFHSTIGQKGQLRKHQHYSVPLTGHQPNQMLGLAMVWALTASPTFPEFHVPWILGSVLPKWLGEDSRAIFSSGWSMIKVHRCAIKLKMTKPFTSGG